MRKLAGFVSVMLLLIPGTLHAQVRTLKGEIIYVQKDDSTKAAAGLEVLVKPLRGSTVTDDDGQFSIVLPQPYKAGEALVFDIKSDTWRIWTPIAGKDRIPHHLAKDMIIIQLLPKGSKKFWSEEFIEYHIAKMAEDAKHEVKPAEPTTENAQVDLGPLIKEWAMEYGFTAQEVKGQIDKWVAEVQEKQEDFYKLGLAAYAKKHFDRAAELFEEDAAINAKQFQLHEQEAEDFREKAIRGYRKAGHSHSSNYDFKKALMAYDQALNYVDKKATPELWVEVYMDIAGANWVIGIRTKGPPVQEHLAKAVAAFEAALEVQTRPQFPQQWAGTQNNLGNVLRDLGIRAGGAKGQEYLAKAVAAYEAVLEVRTRAHLPQQWAGTQNNLGNVLRDLGIRAGGAKGQEYLAKAVAAYEAVLEVRTRAHLPQQWARTQNNLGIVLRDLGIRTGGAKGQEYLAKAVAAYEAALEVRTKKSFAPQWAQTHKNLAETSFALGNWDQVITSYRNVLSLYPDHAQAYYEISFIYHEKLFLFGKVYTGNQEWLQRHPDHTSAMSNFAEAHFTTGRFSEAEKRLGELLANPRLDPQSQVALRIIEIGALAAQDKDDIIPGRLQALRTTLESQSEEFTLGWSFEGTKHFISQNEALASSRTWVLELIAGFEGKNKATMLAAVEAARTNFVAASSAADVTHKK